MPGEGIAALYAAPNPFLLNKICLNEMPVPSFNGLDSCTCLIFPIVKLLGLCISKYSSKMFWNHTWYSAHLRALCTKNSEVHLSIFTELLHEDLSSEVRVFLLLVCFFWRLKRDLHETVL